MARVLNRGHGSPRDAPNNQLYRTAVKIADCGIIIEVAAASELLRSAESRGFGMPERVPESTRAYVLRRWQVALFLVPVVAVALIGWQQYQVRPEYVRLLWADSSGARMSAVAAGWALVVATACLAGAAAVNRSAVRAGWSAGRAGLLAGLLVAWGTVGCLPALYVLLVGPAAVQIMRGIKTG